MHVENILEEGAEKGDPEKPPSIEIVEYMQHIKGPDFPTGATIHGIDDIKKYPLSGSLFKTRLNVKGKKTQSFKLSL